MIFNLYLYSINILYTRCKFTQKTIYYFYINSKISKLLSFFFSVSMKFFLFYCFVSPKSNYRGSHTWQHYPYTVSTVKSEGYHYPNPGTSASSFYNTIKPTHNNYSDYYGRYLMQMLIQIKTRFFCSDLKLTDQQENVVLTKPHQKLSNNFFSVLRRETSDKSARTVKNFVKSEQITSTHKQH